jgi:hypothetical protein
MTSSAIAAELVYTWKTFKIIKMVEYGVSFDVLTSGGTIPPEGARFDAYFDVDLEGPRLNGKMSCADYIHVRPDGRIQLHIHGEITTDDGEKIGVFADGISTHKEGTRFYHNENVTLLTSSPKYSWVNELQVWAKGNVNPGTGEVDIAGYVG